MQDQAYKEINNDDETKDNKERKRKRYNDEDDLEENENGSSEEAGADNAVDEVTRDEEEAGNAKIFSIPTKTQDGGSNTISRLLNQYQGRGTTSTSTRPDAFKMYSDNDTRMLTLLGLDPNPSDGNLRQDWRQLTGFTGFGQEHRRQHHHNVDGTIERRTRLSFELHESMIMYDILYQQQGGQQQQQQQQQDGR